MFKLIYNEQKRALKSFLFWICVIMGVLLAVYDLFKNEIYFNMEISRIGSLTAFIHATALSSSGIFQMCAPLLCTAPYALALVNDVKTSSINNMLSRMKCSDYYLSKAISIISVGGLYFVCTYALLMGACALISPVPSVRIVMEPIIPITSIYQKSLFAFIGCYTLHSFIFGCSYGMFTLGFSSIVQNRYVSLAVPFVLYHSSMLLAWALPKHMVYDLVKYIPYESFNFQLFDLKLILYRHAVVCVAGVIMYFIGIYRYRVQCVS